MRFILNCIVFVLLVSCNEAKNHYEKAYFYYKNKNYKESLSEVEKAEKIDSNNLDFKFLKAKIYYRLDLYDASNLLLKILVEKKHKLDSAYYLMGKNYISLGNDQYVINQHGEKTESLYKKSIKCFDSAIQINCFYFNCYLNKIAALHNLNTPEDELLFINKTINIYKDSTILIMYRGFGKTSIGDFYGAIIDLDYSIINAKLDSFQLSKAYSSKGFSYIRLKKYDSAINNLSMSIKYGEDRYNFYNRGVAYLELNKNDSACQDFRKSANLGLTKAYDAIKKFCQ
jgi:tetratricopeptide (TPR) repeat protein